MEPRDVLLQMRNAIAETSRRVAEARGESNAIADRKTELEQSVGLAKGRLDRKKDVEQFIEDMQAEAHAKRVGDFERLLSALVAEVLPGEKPIGLELDIERGQPSLDIVSRISADLCEDIFEDQGGALTNIVVLGLRMISVVRSGMRKFLVLDEPDCWVKNDRIPAFYSVVKEAARKIGVQCFVISHHETSQFAEGIAISKLHGHPETINGVKVENNPRPYRWQDDEEGLRYIRLINFQGYVDETLNLHPGVNALIGDNNIGKSSFVRAFRAVFYGDVRDTLIRRGEKKSVVEIGMKNGLVLQWTRTPRKNANWKLLGPNGAVVSDEFDTSSRSVPEWVVKQIGIGPIVGLDPHIIKQKLPIFLLDKPGSTRAAVLSIGQEASHIRDMVKTYKKMCETDNSTVKEGEIEMGRLLSREKALKPILEFESELDGLNAIADGFQKRLEENTRIESILTKIECVESQNMRIRNIRAILQSIPTSNELTRIETETRKSKELAEKVAKVERIVRQNEINHNRIAVLKEVPKDTPKLSDGKKLETLADKMEGILKSNERNRAIIQALGDLPSAEGLPEIIRSDDIIKIGKAIRDQTTINSHLKQTIEILRQVPKEIPVLNDTAKMTKMVESVETKIAEVTRLQARKKEAEESVAQSRERLQKAIDEMGNACPLCGSDIGDAEMFFNHNHQHGGHEHA